ncbi:MAG: hemin uptake protein HemP [Pirellulaceae bacterium]
MNRSSDQPQPKAERASSLPEELGQRTISSEEILAGRREVWIQHGDSLYRLCETKTGKLILQK